MKPRAVALYPFVPSGPDFDRAIRFFADLGFAAVWQADGIGGLRFGAAYFMPQDINVREWQANQMITIEVDDLDSYWREIDALSLPEKYEGVRTKLPTDFPWGREVHIIDPAGVCWHISQAAPPR